MTVLQQRSLVFDLYHGNKGKNIISMCHLLLTHQPPFDVLFEDRTDPIVSKSNSDNATKQIKVIYSRNNNPTYLEEHITMDVLQKTSFKKAAGLLQGRTILDTGKKCLATIRKACSIAKEHVKEDGMPKRSSETIEDVINNVLEEMYIPIFST